MFLDAKLKMRIKHETDKNNTTIYTTVRELAEVSEELKEYRLVSIEQVEE